MIASNPTIEGMRVAPTLMAIVVALATFGGAAPAGAQPPKAKRRRAIRLFKRSQSAYEEGRFQDAADLLEKAYALDPNPTLLFNLARAKEGAGDWEGTIETYRRYLEADPKAKDRAAIERRIKNIEAQLEQRRALEQKAEEERKRREAVERQAEEERQRREALEKERRAKPPPPPPPAPPPPVKMEPRAVSPWPWIILGVGALGVGAGGVLGAMAADKHTLAVDEPVQTTAKELDDRAQGFALGANIAFAAGGAVALAGLVWGIVDVATLGEKTKPDVVVGPSAERAGVVITGTF